MFVIKTDRKPEPVTELWLEEHPKGIALKAHRAGEGRDAGWFILLVYPDGTIRRSPNLPDDLGFQIDESGRAIDFPIET